MALVVGKLCLPGDELARPAFAISMTNEDADYPAKHAIDNDPALLCRATTNSTVITVNMGTSKTPVGVALINTNAEAAAISNSAGLNEAITIPALDADGQRVHGWKDLTGLANRTATSFNITLSRASGAIFFGRVVIVGTWRDVNWPSRVTFEVHRPGSVRMVTRLGTVVHHDADIRVRSAEATFDLEEDAAMWRALARSAKGATLPFLLIPDITVNDAWWVRQPETFRERPGPPGFTEITRRFEELSSGPPNG